MGPQRHDSPHDAGRRDHGRHANKGNPIALVELNLVCGALIESDIVNATLKAELAAKPADPSIIQMMGEIHRSMRRKIADCIKASLHPRSRWKICIKQSLLYSAISDLNSSSAA